MAVLYAAASFILPRLFHHRLKLLCRDFRIPELGRLLRCETLELGPEQGAAGVAETLGPEGASLHLSTTLTGVRDGATAFKDLLGLPTPLAAAGVAAVFPPTTQQTNLSLYSLVEMAKYSVS